MEKNTIIYSIGRRCNAIEFLQKYKLFTECSPFDWEVVDFKTVIQMLKQDFKGYCDNIYLPWTGQLVRNVGKYPLPKEKGFTYLKIKLPRHRNFAVNLATVDVNHIPKNIYNARTGLYFFHYDLKDPLVVQKKQKRIQRFLSNKHKSVLFHIWTTLPEAKIKETKEYIVNLVGSIGYRFIIVLCVESYKQLFEVDETHSPKITFLCLRVPPLVQQLKTKPNENNIDDARINWIPVVQYMKKVIV